MKLSALFRTERTSLQRTSAQDQAEKLLAESFRLLGQVCGKMADYLEAQRLGRAGYADQGKFLERLDPQGRPKPPGV